MYVRTDVLYCRNGVEWNGYCMILSCHIMSCHVMLSYEHVNMRYVTCFGYNIAQMTFLASWMLCFSLRPKLEARCSDGIRLIIWGRLVGIFVGIYGT